MSQWKIEPKHTCVMKPEGITVFYSWLWKKWVVKTSQGLFTQNGAGDIYTNCPYCSKSLEAFE
ncbi:MAG: hypothetical protein IH840_00140 [Candidatus Heimdallarchaeota archaeon]|nr:hypothetical protein [Candidatus Heimdallarchaeota archaeon]